MKTFSEYHKEQEIKEFSQWLESQGYDPQTLDLESLLEAGAWEKAKKWGKGAALAGVLGAAALGVMPQGDSNAPLQQQTQSQSQDAPSQQQVSHEDGVTVEGDTVIVRTSDKNGKISLNKAYKKLANHLKTNQIPPGAEHGTKKGDDGLFHTTMRLSKSGSKIAADIAAKMGNTDVQPWQGAGQSNVVKPLPSGKISPDSDL
jgi:hypothetical protein